jgi:GT2 family glycosyltransferase
LIAVGWVWSPRGPVDLQIFCDGKPLHSVQLGLTRSDVGTAWPSVPDAAKCGFVGVIDVDTLAAGTHTIVLSAVAPGGMSREWRRAFIVGDQEAGYQRWLARCALQPARWNDPAPTSWSLTVIVEFRVSDDHPALWRTLGSVLRLRPNPREIIVLRSAEAANSTPSRSVERESRCIGGIMLRQLSGSLSDAIAASVGDWITVLTAGELLHPQALQPVAALAVLHPACGLWYADHDHIRGHAVRHRPVLKPAWSPVWLRRHNYIGHPWFADGPASRAIASMHHHATPLREHDVLRQLGEVPAQSVGHIPSVLLSRPDEHALRTTATRPERRQAGATPRVSIVIPSRLSAPDILARCLDGLTRQTHYPDLEVIVALNGVATPGEGVAWLSRWPSVVALNCDGPFNWSRVNNLAAERAQGEILLFLNDDIECHEPNWLAAMVALAEDVTVGAVGAVLRYPDGRVQHAGVRVTARPAVECRHTLRYCRFDDPELQWLLGSDREQTAVTGACLMTRREVFQRTGGFDEQLALVLNDVDYCLRLGRMGLRSVVAADAVLIHHEGLSRAGMPETEDVRIFEQRWQGVITPVDPYHHPSLRRDTDDWTLDCDAVASDEPRVLSAHPEVVCFEPGRGTGSTITGARIARASTSID